MSHYLLTESFPQHVWRGILEGVMDPHPYKDTEVFGKAIEKTFGGKLLNVWLSCEKCEMLSVIEVPDIMDTAAMTMLNMARGNTNPMRITPLLTPEEASQAISKAMSTLKFSEENGYVLKEE